MKNVFKENLEKEMAAKEAARKAAEEQARLDAIEPVGIPGTMDQIVSGHIRCDRDENGVARGVNGGKLLQERVEMYDGKMTIIAAETPEEMTALKEKIAQGYSGDGKFHKQLFINGYIVDCAGATPELLAEDIQAAKEDLKAQENNDAIKTVDIADQLVDAGYKSDDVEDIFPYNNCKCARFVLSYKENRVMDTSGKTIVDLSDITSKLNRKDVKTLLVDKFNKWVDDYYDSVDIDTSHEEYNYNAKDALYDQIEECLQDIDFKEAYNIVVEKCPEYDGETLAYVECNNLDDAFAVAEVLNDDGFSTGVELLDCTVKVC